MLVLRRFAVLSAALLFVGIFTLGASAESGNGTQNFAALFGKSYASNKTVSKKEFAKALAASLNLASRKNESCYRDVKKGADAAGEICALKKAKIFKGKKTSKFSPKAKVTWDFAIEGLCRAGKWEPKPTLKSCLAHAKAAGWLTSSFTEKKKVTYGELVAFMERSSVAAAATQPAPATDVSSSPAPSVAPAPLPAQPVTLTLPAKTPSSSSFTPFPEEVISPTFFSGAALSSPLPNRFYKDEVYFVEGDLTGGSTEEVFVFLCRENQGCDDSIDFIEDTTQNGTHFKVPVFFRETGNYTIGLIAGRSGQSKIKNISVVSELPSPPAGMSLTDLDARYSEGNTTFSWNGTPSDFLVFTIFQNAIRRDYIFRQKLQRFSPPSEDFSKFSQGPTAWFVTNGSTQSQVQTMQIVTKHFRKINTNEVMVSSMLEVYGAPQHFVFSGRANAAIAPKAAVTLPNGQVEDIHFATADIPSGQSFQVEFDMKENGTYIFEVNNPHGSAVVNVPLYVGPGIPLIPDYFALNQPKLDTKPIGDLDSARQELLRYINKDRTDHGLNPVSISKDLNAIAQGHSQNMVNQNFFGHDNPQGQSPDDRRKAANYPAGIRENLAKSTTLEDVEQGLMRSPVHRSTIVDSKMKRVGLGIVKNSEGYLIVTQNFSGDPLTEDVLPEIKLELFSKALSARSNNGLEPIFEDTTLASVATEWSEKMKTEKFFGVKDPTGISVVDMARSRNIESSIQVHIIKASDRSLVVDELMKQSGLLKSSNRNIGIGLSVSQIGELFITSLYTP